MQRIISAFASDAETASIRCPVPITVAGPRPAISFSTSSAMITSCCWYPPSAQPTESSRKRLAWYTASCERCLYSSPAAQQDMAAVMVSLVEPCVPVDNGFTSTYQLNSEKKLSRDHFTFTFFEFLNGRNAMKSA